MTIVQPVTCGSTVEVVSELNFIMLLRGVGGSLKVSHETPVS